MQHPFGHVVGPHWALHTPATQTWLVPQDVPSVTWAPVSTHEEVPVAHEVVPTSQLFVGVHDTFAVQATHTPALHTWFVPHDVPFAAAFPVSVQVATPPAHDVIPVWQGLAGTHDAPGEHALHTPP